MFAIKNAQGKNMYVPKNNECFGKNYKGCFKATLCSSVTLQ